MCIAILNVGHRLSDSALANSWETNNDGAGIGYIKDEKLVVEKFPSELNYFGATMSPEFEAFIKRYEEIYEAYSEHPILVHFRISTSGFSDEMLHPFTIGEDLIMMHNGIIPNLGTNDVSDTKELADILATSHAPQCIITDPAVTKMLEDIIGYSKLVFLDHDGEYHIVNESMGNWESDGNWFSNNSHVGYSYYRRTNESAGNCSVGKSNSGATMQNGTPRGTTTEMTVVGEGITDEESLNAMLDSKFGFGGAEEASRKPLVDTEDDENCKGCQATHMGECMTCCIFTKNTADVYFNDSYMDSVKGIVDDYGDRYLDEEKEKEEEERSLAQFQGFCSECGSQELRFDDTANAVYCFGCDDYPTPFSKDIGVFEYDDAIINPNLI